MEDIKKMKGGGRDEEEGEKFLKFLTLILI